MKKFFSVLFFSLMLVPVPALVSADSDSLVFIKSFYRGSDESSIFATSQNGDTVALVYAAKINKTSDALDTTHLQVRTWNSVNASTLRTLDFFHVQSSAVSALYKVGNIGSVPCLFYSPTPQKLSVINMYDGSNTRDVVFPDTISNIFLSPDFTHTFVVTISNQYFIVNLLSGEFVLRDSVWKGYPTLYRGDRYDVHFKVRCQPNSWSTDNSLLMIETDKWMDLSSTGASLGFQPYWRPYDMIQRRYLADSIDMQDHGRWLPNAKRFVTYTAQQLYITKLDLSRKIIATGKYIYDFGWLDNTTHMTIIDPGTSISVWDMDSTKKLLEFSPGNLIGYAFNSDASLLAYVTDSNRITVMNTSTFQGIYSIDIPFVHAIAFSDQSTFRWLNGNKALIIADSFQNYHILDLPASTIVATVDSGDVFAASPDGTALFVLHGQMTRYDLFTGKQLSTFPKDELLSQVRGISLSPDGSRLLMLDSLVRLWDARSAKLLIQHDYPNTMEARWSYQDSVILLHREDVQGKYLTALRSSDLSSLYTISFPQFRFLGMTSNARSVLVGCGDSVKVFDVHNGNLDYTLVNDATVTSADLSLDGTQLVTGDTNGYARIFTLSDSTKIFEHKAYSQVDRVVLGSTKKYLSFISKDANTVLRIPEGTRVQNLSTPTLETFFINNDSLCIGIYNEAIIEFFTSNGQPTKMETSSRAYFRPQKNYYVVASPDARDSLALFDYARQHADRALHNLPINTEVVWSHNSATLASVDIFNSVVIWTPSNLKPGDLNTEVDETLISDDASVIIFPQPARDVLLLKSERAATVVNARIKDMLGNSTVVMCTSKGVYRLEGFASGVYLFELSFEDGSVIHKSVVITR